MITAIDNSNSGQPKPHLVSVPLISKQNQDVTAESTTSSKLSTVELPASRPLQDGDSSKLNFLNSKGINCPSSISHETVKVFEEQLRGYVREFTLEHGISLTELDVKLSHDQKEVTFLVKASSLNFYGMDNTATSYLINAEHYGFKPAWLGQKFTATNSMDLVITGMDINQEGEPRLRVCNGASTFFVRENSFQLVIEAFK
jgi:hypothetical protein